MESNPLEKIGPIVAAVPGALAHGAKILLSPFGRVRRRTLWIYGGVVSIVAWIIYNRLDAKWGAETEHFKIYAPMILAPFAWMLICMLIKRWHDRDKSGWWVLVNLIPYAGWLWSLIVNGFLEGTIGQNRYGSDPKSRGSRF